MTMGVILSDGSSNYWYDSLVTEQDIWQFLHGSNELNTVAEVFDDAFRVPPDVFDQFRLQAIQLLHFFLLQQLPTDLSKLGP